MRQSQQTTIQNWARSATLEQLMEKRDRFLSLTRFADPEGQKDFSRAIGMIDDEIHRRPPASTLH